MMPLSFIGIENFRIFKERHDLQLRPITVLTGMNSSGKTTAIQALLLLKNYLSPLIWPNDVSKRMDDIQKLTYDTIDERLGGFSKLINTSNADLSKEIKFYLPFFIKDVEDSLTIEITLAGLGNKLQEGELSGLTIYSTERSTSIFRIHKEQEQWHVHVNLLYFADHYSNGFEKRISLRRFFEFEEEPIVRSEAELKALLDEFFELLKTSNEAALNFLLKNKGIEELQQHLDTYLENEDEVTAEERKISFLRVYLAIVTIMNFEEFKLNDEVYHELLFEDFGFTASSNTRSLKKIFSLLSDPSLVLQESSILKLNPRLSCYLAAGDLKIVMVDEDIPDFVAPEESGHYMFFNRFVASRILSGIQKLANDLGKTNYLPSIRNIIRRNYSIKKPETEFNRILADFVSADMELDPTVLQFLEHYIRVFSIGEGIVIKQNEGELSNQVYLLDKGAEVHLADLGYGISQFLPILLKICVQAIMNREVTLGGYNASTLIIEEPETNLHPALQSKLADMFVDANERFKLHFLIETHSEYLIRKFQYLVGTKCLDPKEFVCYYFDKSGEDLNITTIEINDKGGLTDDFGTGFFDESTHWKFELIKLNNSQKN